MHKPKGPTITYMPESSIGGWAKSIRLALDLTRPQLAAMTGVDPHDIELFENNLPVSVEVRRRLVKELSATRDNH
ncbi:MAG TPA: hypothetical protein VJ377_03020 [Dehalococcoidales bacterium]|nr:hypothetical protein [Dehalococcoidales bacterium]